MRNNNDKLLLRFTHLVEDEEVGGWLRDLAVLTLLLHDDAAESRAQGQRGIA